MKTISKIPIQFRISQKSNQCSQLIHNAIFFIYSIVSFVVQINWAVPFKMFAAIERVHPNTWDEQSILLQSTRKEKHVNNLRTTIIWNQGSPIIGSQFNKHTIYNNNTNDDENDGLVFGWPGRPHYTKHLDYVWWVSHTNYR